MNMKRLNGCVTAILLATLLNAHAGVVRYTVGIDVNCPAGLGE